MAAETGPIVVYTDGACRGNPGPGGWAWAVPDGAYASGAEGHTTNQRMEITAALMPGEDFSADRRLLDEWGIEVTHRLRKAATANGEEDPHRLTR